MHFLHTQFVMKLRASRWQQNPGFCNAVHVRPLYKGLYREALPMREKAYLFQASSIWKGRNFTSWGILWLWKRREKFSNFSICLHYTFLKKAHLQQLKVIQSSKLGRRKWYHLSIKGYFFCKKCYIKGWTSDRSQLHIKTLTCPSLDSLNVTSSEFSSTQKTAMSVLFKLSNTE